MQVKSLRHYGWPISHFSAKTRSYLRFKGIAFKDECPNGLALMWKVRRAVGRVIMPTVQLPNGKWLQDSSAIIDTLETMHPSPPLHPDGPTQRLAAYLLEYFADEWMQLTSLHSRWDFSANAQLAKRDFAHYALPGLPFAISGRLTKPMIDHMLAYQPAMGIDETTRDGIDEVMVRLLDSLQEQLESTDYVLGNRPTLGDFALFGPLSTHTNHEPASKPLIQQRPAVGAWLERLTRGTPTSGTLLADDAVPQSLDPLFQMIFGDQMPWLRTVVTAIDAYVDTHPDAKRVPRALGMAPFSVCGRTGERKMITFTQWKGQRVRDAYDAADGGADKWLARFGTPSSLIPEIRNRTSRKDFKEVLSKHLA